METSHNFETQNELEFFDKFYLCHRNIVNYITHDTIFDETVSHWLAMPLFINGNLYYYLKDHSLSLDQMLIMIQDIVSGLNYLHSVFDPNSKPRIAHRDIKSCNILVDYYLHCCIGDFGLAICDSNTSEASLKAYLRRKSNIQLGTKRYMSPELLSMSFNKKFIPHRYFRSFDSYLKMDIYSLSLVLWEIFNR
ncbi:hypothetical protein HZS_4762, partial [Henneguya salminicola]